MILVSVWDNLRAFLAPFVASGVSRKNLCDGTVHKQLDLASFSFSFSCS